MRHRLICRADDGVDDDEDCQDSQNSVPENSIAAERDGHLCAITNVSRFQSCYLLPRAKGDEVS